MASRHSNKSSSGAEVGGGTSSQKPPPITAALYRELAGQLELEPLIATVLTAVARLTGARSAQLLLPREGRLQPAAVARSQGKRLRIETAAHAALPPPAHLPRAGARSRVQRDPAGDVYLPLHHRRKLTAMIHLSGTSPTPALIAELEQLAPPVAAALAAAQQVERLRREAARYSLMVNTAIEGIWQIDEHDVTTFVNARFAEMMHYRVEEMLGRPLLDFVHAADRDIVRQLLRERRTGQISRRDLRYLRKDGSELWALVVAQPIFDAAGGYRGAFALLVDIAERRRAEMDLRRSEEKYRLLVETSRDLIWYMDLEGRYTFLNRAAKAIFGYEPEEMLGRPFTDFQTPDQAAHCHEVFARMRAGVPFERYETVHRRKDGSPVILSFNAVVVRDEQGRVIGTTGTAADVTELKRAEDALRASEERLRLVLDQLPAAVWTTDNDLTITSSRGAALGRIGLRPEQLIGRHMRDTEAFVPDDPIVALCERALRGERNVVEETRRGRRFQTHVQPLRDADGAIIGTLGIALDVTELRRSEEALLQERERAQVTLEAITDGVIATDLQGRVQFLNPAAQALCGWPQAEAQGRPLHEVMVLEDELTGAPIVDLVSEVLRQGKATTLGRNSRLRRRDGSAIAVEDSAAPIRDSHGAAVGVVVAFHDVSASRMLAAQLSHQATHDPLTDLPNRALLLDRLEQAIANAQRHFKRLALLFLDLDRFKYINDTLGHPVGDQLLKQVAARLCSCVRRNDTVSRQGGDEFVVLLAEMDRPEHATEVAQKMITTLAAPYRVDGNELHITTSIGISVYPDDGQTSSTLVKHADIAMYHAKENGRNNYQFFTESMNRRALQRVFLERSLRRALDRGELALYYQPQLSLPSGRIVGAEALLRWHHPERGLISPEEFIPVAEDSGLILSIGEWVLHSACRAALAWQRGTARPRRVAVNVSMLQFRHRDLVDMVRGALCASGLPPELLELELTESVVMHDPEQAVERLAELKTLGVRLAIDDFGTGYSSLGALKRLPVDRLKIDRSFVRDIHIDPDDAAIALAAIRLGHSLRLSVLAEGVEHQAALRFLVARRCDAIQGYLISEPLPLPRFEALLATQAGRPL